MAHMASILLAPKNTTAASWSQGTDWIDGTEARYAHKFGSPSFNRNITSELTVGCWKMSVSIDCDEDACAHVVVCVHALEWASALVAL